VKDKGKRTDIAVRENMKTPYGYMKSHAIWDHTVLPTYHQAAVTFPRLTPAAAGTRLSDPGRTPG